MKMAAGNKLNSLCIFVLDKLLLGPPCQWYWWSTLLSFLEGVN